MKTTIKIKIFPDLTFEIKAFLIVKHEDIKVFKVSEFFYCVNVRNKLSDN